MSELTFSMMEIYYSSEVAGQKAVEIRIKRSLGKVYSNKCLVFST